MQAAPALELIDIMRNVKIGVPPVCNFKVSTVTIWTFFPKGSRTCKNAIKNFYSYSLSSGAFGECAFVCTEYSSFDSKFIPNKFAVTWWRKYGNQATDRHALNSCSITRLSLPPFHPSVSSSLSLPFSSFSAFSVSQVKHRVYDTVLLASGNSLPAITLVVRTVRCHI